jgi:putative copper export protein
MSPAFVVDTAVRWAGLVALAALVGGLVLETLLLPGDSPETDAARARLRRLGVAWLVLLAAATGGELLARARTMAGGDLSAAVAAVPVVLARTHFGAVWRWRLGLLALALLLSPSAARWARRALLALALALSVTTTLTGHAADWGDLTPSAAIDWMHVLSTSVWAGGLLCLALCVLGPARQWPLPLLGVVIGRFSRLAGLCLLAAILTGGYNAWVQLPGVSSLWSTAYGRALGAKLALVVGLVWWGAASRYGIVARLAGAHRSSAGERLFRIGRLVLLGAPRIARRALASRLCAYARREAGLVLLVLGCTAVLVDSTPARHAGHAAHRVASEPGPVRVTMDELHESGGVPRGWILAPPAGDAARGREIFARLGCHACHRSGDPALPPSSGLGPDLIGVGEHHPAAYILESILNPSAVIIDEPGYTDASGRSIMPDYRGRLSVAELIDLVAYVKTL